MTPKQMTPKRDDTEERDTEEQTALENVARKNEVPSTRHPFRNSSTATTPGQAWTENNVANRSTHFLEKTFTGSSPV
jgi:hypothetical protein